MRRQFDGFQCGEFHPQADVDIAVSGVELSMAEPSGNGGNVDFGLKQVHRGGVTEHVRGDSFSMPRFEPSVGGEGAEDIGDAGAGESAQVTVDKQRAISSAALPQPVVDGGESSFP